MRKWTKNTWRCARGRNMKGGGLTCWAGKESWTSGGEWHQDSKTQINQNQNSLLQPMRFVNRRIYMIPSICSEICWFSRYYNNNNNNNKVKSPNLKCLLHYQIKPSASKLWRMLSVHIHLLSDLAFGGVFHVQWSTRKRSQCPKIIREVCQYLDTSVLLSSAQA